MFSKTCPSFATRNRISALAIVSYRFSRRHDAAARLRNAIDSRTSGAVGNFGEVVSSSGCWLGGPERRFRPRCDYAQSRSRRDAFIISTAYRMFGLSYPQLRGVQLVLFTQIVGGLMIHLARFVSYLRRLRRQRRRD